MTTRDDDALTRLLAGGDLEPPPAVDRAVRRRLRALPAGAGLPRGLALAGWLSAAGFGALVAAAAIALAAAGAAEAGPAIALAGGLAWLALGAAASLPLLLLPVWRPVRRTAT